MRKTEFFFDPRLPLIFRAEVRRISALNIFGDEKAKTAAHAADTPAKAEANPEIVNARGRDVTQLCEEIKELRRKTTDLLDEPARHGFVAYAPWSGTSLG